MRWFLVMYLLILSTVLSCTCDCDCPHNSPESWSWWFVSLICFTYLYHQHVSENP